MVLLLYFLNDTIHSKLNQIIKYFKVEYKLTMVTTKNLAQNILLGAKKISKHISPCDYK